jgi:PAS domain S-box-containing protein
VSRRAFLFTFATLVAVAEAAMAAVIATRSHYENLGTTSISIALTAGLSFVASGLIAIRRRPENKTGFYLAAVGYFWMFGALGNARNAWLYTAGNVLGNVAFVFFAALLLAYPYGELRTRRDKAIPLVLAAVLTLGNLGVLLVAEGPYPTSCKKCPPSVINVTNSLTAAKAIYLATTLGAIVIAFWVIATMYRRWRRATPPLRRVLAPVIATSGLVIAVIIVSSAMQTVTTSGAREVTYVFVVAFAAVPLSFLYGILRVRLARSSAAGLLLQLERGESLHDALADALGDPSLEIAYRLDEPGEWVDAEGRSVPEPRSAGGRAVTYVERGGQRIAALVHDPTISQEPELVYTVATAAGIALHNERLQAELRSQYRFLETTLDTAPSLLAHVDLEGRIVRFNRAVEEASGLAEDRIRDALFWNVFIDGQEREAMQARFWAASPEHPPAEYENVFVNARGERRVITWRSAPLKNESGETFGIMAGGIDITERRERELEFERQRNITVAIVEGIPTLLLIVDEHGVLVRDGHAANRAFFERLGWTEQELAGLSFVDHIELDDTEEARVRIAAAASGGRPEEIETRWACADGTSVVVAWTAAGIQDPSDAGRTLVLLAGTDVTERITYERELRASRARLVEAGDSERRRLERNLHDGAQQRLASLSLTIRLARGKLRADPAAADELLERASGELAHALEELRELARGIHPAVLTERGLGAALESLAVRMPLPVELRIPEDRLPAAVEAAAYYVAAEALANVVKYSQASSVTVSADHLDDMVVVEVVDDGVGGADPSTGTGLSGLRDRVGALDGRLSVESPEGGGTRVVAEIPLAPAPAEPQPAAQGASS